MPEQSNHVAVIGLCDIVLLAVRDQTQAHSALLVPDGCAADFRHGAPVILASTVGPEAALALAGHRQPPASTGSAHHRRATCGGGRRRVGRGRDE